MELFESTSEPPEREGDEQAPTPMLIQEGSSAEPLLPPEAQGDVNGGPLGCCLGVTIGLLLSLIIAVVSRLYGDQLFSVFQGSLSVLVRVLMGLAAVAEASFFGYLGWRIGKRLYREYEPPVLKDRTRKRAV